MVEIEKLDDGRWRVSRVLPCGASMQAAATALEQVVPEAYASTSVSDDWTKLIRDDVEPLFPDGHAQ